MREMVGGCCVCSDDRGWSENPLVYCDGQSCTVAVHQACYGIVTVPTGPWYCRKCESQERSVKVKCELCPSKYGALKRTDNSGWAHVVCALYIPEVRFGNVTTMEPIQLQLIPAERFNKVCYICEEKGKPANCTVGACMQCNKAGCKQQFHVTCAQSLGLLCEEAGNYLDNVKYCGYCQYHYSKLKKGGHVKTIPPYKPVSNETHNSDSNSEKESEAVSSSSKNSPPFTGGKKKSAASGKVSAPSKTSAKTTLTQQKTVHNNGRSSEKIRSNSRSAKSDDTNSEPVVDTKVDKKDIGETEIKEKESVKDVKISKKRKANSRTPTPVATVTTSEISVAVTSVVTTTASASSSSSISAVSDRKSSSSGDSSAEKAKKTKVETTQSILHNQPVVALTSISAAKLAVSPSTTTLADSEVPPAPVAPSIIQTTQTTQQAQSLVVSVPLVNAALSPRDVVVGGNQTSVFAQASATVSVPVSVPMQVTTTERSASAVSTERSTPILSEIMTGGNSNQGILTSEMSGGGLKITYEKQMDSINTEVDMELELEPSPSTAVQIPVKRTRSQSQNQERPERSSRSNTKKRSSNSNGVPSSAPASVNNSLSKRASRSQHHQQMTLQLQQAAQQQMAMPQDTTPSPSSLIPETEPPGAFAAVSQMKESPPSSPSSESQQESIQINRTGRHRSSRKSAPASVGGGGSNSGIGVGGGSSRDSKDIKLFQNGLTAPHMLGNHLNPSSTMHSKMTDHLNSELEAHSIFNPNENHSNLIGPQMHHRVVQSVRASSTGSSTASGGSGLSSMLGGGGGNIPQTLDQLLERQWEQGSQFLMEQAQHFDIASLLSCLHQLRAENLRLEEHVGSLLQRRDHLLAVNARLAIPLTGQPATPQSSHPHTVNNIHPSVAATHSDIPRPLRHSSGSQAYASHPQGSTQHQPVENGLPPDTYPQNSHRSPATGGPRSPTVRHSPAGAFAGGGSGGSGRPSAPRPQPYPSYDRQGPSTSSTQPQHQMVIRRERERDTDLHHHSSSKTS